MANFKIIIEYDGTDFHGWQVQPGVRTVQGELESAISIMTRTRCRVIGSGRTDAGVHALNQVANFKSHTRIAPQGFKNGINALTGPDIAIKSCDIVNDSFHSRYDAKRKIYQYHIYNDPIPSPVKRRYSWHIALPLDLKAMSGALKYLEGTHDFKAFEGSGSPRSSTVRKIFSAGLKTNPAGGYILEIEADGFLKHMVRNIAGAVVYVGLHRITKEDLKKILESRDRRLAPPTAPATGLFLKKVVY